MSSYSRNRVVLVRYPFSDLAQHKVRPAVVVSAPHVSQDLFVVPLTSKIISLLPGEFQLADWRSAGLNVPSATKRAVYTIHESLVVKSLGVLSVADAERLAASLRSWFGLVQ